MNKDNLEQFVRENRAAFDSEVPSPDLWSRIHDDLGQKEHRILPWRRYLLWAASVAVIVGLTWMAKGYYDRSKLAPVVAGTDEQIPVENPEIRELLEAEVYYAAQFDDRYARISSILEDQPEILDELQGEFEMLDSAYAGLRQELNENIATEQIIEAMIQNHRIKAGILNEILKQLQHENPDHEKTYDF